MSQRKAESSSRIGIDLGGTKIEGVVLDRSGEILCRRRIPTPSGDYAGTVLAIRDLVAALEAETAANLRVGLAMPGAISPRSGLVKNANSTCLNGRPFAQDLEEALGRRIRLANDADCFALSEATDGAGAGAASVFGVILGTGVGGGIVRDGKVLSGPNAIAGEWGHNPLPWPQISGETAEVPGPPCYCGKTGCIETFLSGPGLAADHRASAGESLSADLIAARAVLYNGRERATMERYLGRLARSLASVINILDPEVIVLGGGLSGIGLLYERVPLLWERWVFSDSVETRLLPPRHGDSSGVRGAAWLWPADPP